MSSISRRWCLRLGSADGLKFVRDLPRRGATGMIVGWISHWGGYPRPSGTPVDRSSADMLAIVKDRTVFRKNSGELSTIKTVMCRY